ncbi:MAG: AIPR family protein [Hyphomicrobiaceae bacterium]
MELALAERLLAFGTAWGLCETPTSDKPSKRVSPEVFEVFATHVVLNGLRHLELDRNDILALITGGADDAKLDAVGLFIDGVLILSEEDLLSSLDAIDESSKIEFIFIQATLMPNLAQGKVEKTCTGISNFAAETAMLAENRQVRHMRRLKEQLLEGLEQRGIRLKPACTLYIVWPSSQALLRPDHHGILELRRRDIERLGRFQSVALRLVDGPELLLLADRNDRRNTIELPFSELATFDDAPTRPGTEVDSWIGRIVASDLIRAIQSPEGTLRSELFTDNVRFDLGETGGSVNEAIGQTLESPARRRFHLMNNGLTLVARDVRPSGPLSLTCRDLKIINGCQTTYSLFRHQAALDPSVKVLAKIIATEDRELVDRISVASNRQTAIAPVQFFSRLPFVRRLQLHFDALEDAHGQRVIWFERRRGESFEWKRENGQRVIDVEDMIRAYASAILERPELPQNGDWRTLRSLVPDKIFHRDHDVEVYEIAALLAWRARELMRMTERGDGYPAKNHLVLAMRLIADPLGLRPAPIQRSPKDRQGQAYVRLMREALLSDRRAREIARQAHAVVVAVASGMGGDFNAKTFQAVDATHRVVDMAGRRDAAE